MKPSGDGLGRGRRKGLKVIPHVGQIRGCPVSGSNARHGSPLWLLNSFHGLMCESGAFESQVSSEASFEIGAPCNGVAAQSPMMSVPDLGIWHKSPLSLRFASLWHRRLGVRTPIRAKGLTQLRDSVKLKGEPSMQRASMK
jgi:hypothetical protein